MSQPLRLGIVGCGMIASVHADMYTKAGQKVAWLYDPSPASLERFSKMYPDAKIAPTVEAMADRSLIDAASVCSPPACHAPNCLPLIEAGVPVLCEKPLSADLAGAEAIAAAVRRKKALFMVGFVHRFRGSNIELHKLVHSGKLGRPILFRNIYSRYAGDMTGNSNIDPKLAGGGALTANGSHSIDLCRWLVGEPVRVQAMGGTALQNTTVEDIAILQMELTDKTFAEITASFSLHLGPYDVEWYGTEGSAVVSYFGADSKNLRYTLAGQKDWTTVDCSAHPDIFEGEIAHFLDCVRTGATPQITVEDGVEPCRVLTAAYRSMRSGGSVMVRS